MANIITLRLNINGVAVIANTYPNTSLQITKTVSDIENLSGQGIITEETFRVPLVDKLIEHLGDLTDFGQNPKVDINKAIEGQVLINNFPIYSGSFNIISAFKNTQNDIKELELIFKGNESDIKSVLTKIKLSDLLEGETLPYTYSEVRNFLVNSVGYIETNGYAWPLIDYGQRFTQDPDATEGRILAPTNTTNPLTQRDFKPAVWVKYLFDKMPYEITVDETMEDLLDQVIPLHNSNQLMPVLDTNINLYVSYMRRTSDVAIAATTLTKVPFNQKYTPNGDMINLSSLEYEAPYAGFYTFIVSGNIEVTGDTLPPVGTQAFTRIQLRLNTSGYSDVTFWDFFTAVSVSVNRKIQYERTVFLNKDDIFTLRYSINEVTGSSSSVLKEGFRFELIRSPAISPTSNVLIDKNCPNLTAWDVFRTIVTQANAIIERNIDGGVNLIPWVKWINENDTVVNLNDSVDKGTDIRIEPFSIKGAKRIVLKYLDDEDLLNKKYLELIGETYGTLTIEDTGTDFATNEIKIELPFAATPQQTPTNGFYPIPKFYNENFEIVKTKPRLLPFNRNPATAADFIDVGSPLFANAFNFLETTQLGLFLSFNHWISPNGGYNTNDFNFGQSLTFFASSGYPNQTLYKRFWEKYIEQTYSRNARLIEMGVKLNKAQATEYKLNEKFFLGNSMFRVTGINNLSLISDDPVKITMLKRFEIENIEKAPFYPYDVIDTIVQWKDSMDNTDLGDASTEPSADVQESANAYGFFYDSGNNLAIQQGQILQF